MEKIRKGDDVIVITGKDKGKRGTVLRRVDEDHVLVEGVNRAKKHVKPNPVKGVAGGIVDKGHADSSLQCCAVQSCDSKG